MGNDIQEVDFLGSNGRTYNKLKTDKIKPSYQQECSIDSDCIEMAVNYMKILTKNIGNYLTQDRRITKQNKTMCK